MYDKIFIVEEYREGVHMSNPILNENRFNEQERILEGMPMTINGTIQITAFLGLLLICAATFVWSRMSAGFTDLAMMLTGGGTIIGFILALIFAMLALYKMRLIQATDKFRSVIFITTASIAGIYLVDLLGRWLFHMQVPLINSVSPAGIIISLVIVAVAALNLILDFDFIERGEKMMLPKDYEWYGAFGLMLTLVWLYLEILKLLSKLNKR